MAAISLPARLACGKVLVRICDALVVLFFELVLRRLRIWVAAQPEVLDKLVTLFVVARIGGGTNARVSHYGDLFLVLHVGMLTAAFAGFTLAAGLAALYLWQEHRLKGRAPDILRMRLPPLASLEFLAWRTILVSLPLLTLGLAIGVIRQRRDGGTFDQREILTLLAWIVYGGFLAARPTGRRAACLALGGFALVVIARVALAGSHFT